MNISTSSSSQRHLIIFNTIHRYNFLSSLSQLFSEITFKKKKTDQLVNYKETLVSLYLYIEETFFVIDIVV